jgi:hypothetical protein
MCNFIKLFTKKLGERTAQRCSTYVIGEVVQSLLLVYFQIIFYGMRAISMLKGPQYAQLKPINSEPQWGKTKSLYSLPYLEYSILERDAP